MAFEDEDRMAVDRVDAMLRSDEVFYGVPLKLDRYKEWYALTLGALVTVAGSDEITFAHARYSKETDSARFLVFTSKLLTVVDVSSASDDDAVVSSRTISRRMIHSLALTISDRHDDDRWGRRLRQWPGELQFTLEYATVAEPIVFAAPSHNPYQPEETAEGVILLNGLRVDLSNSMGV